MRSAAATRARCGARSRPKRAEPESRRNGRSTSTETAGEPSAAMCARIVATSGSRSGAVHGSGFSPGPGGRASSSTSIGRSRNGQNERSSGSIGWIRRSRRSSPRPVTGAICGPLRSMRPQAAARFRNASARGNRRVSSLRPSSVSGRLARSAMGVGSSATRYGVSRPKSPRSSSRLPGERGGEVRDRRRDPHQVARRDDVERRRSRREVDHQRRVGGLADQALLGRVAGAGGRAPEAVAHDSRSARGRNGSAVENAISENARAGSSSSDSRNWTVTFWPSGIGWRSART